MGLGRFFCLLKITRSGKRRALKQIQDRSTPLPTSLVFTGLHENDLARVQANELPGRLCRIGPSMASGKAEWRST